MTKKEHIYVLTNANIQHKKTLFAFTFSKLTYYTKIIFILNYTMYNNTTSLHLT